MKIGITILLFFVSSFTFAQPSSLKETVVKLEKALVAKDTTALKQLLHQDLTYGHSNGWIETKEDIIKNLTSGKLIYHKIESDSVGWKTGANWASRRSHTKIEATLNGNALHLNLHVLQVWLKTKQGWQLVARQSTKL